MSFSTVEILTRSLKSKRLTNEQFNSNCQLCGRTIETVYYTACWYLSGSVYFSLTLQHKLANLPENNRKKKIMNADNQCESSTPINNRDLVR